MTRTQALMELRSRRDKVNDGPPEPQLSELQLDEDDLILFFAVPEEHADYVIYRAVEESPGDYRLEETFDLEAGTVSLTRVWRTPKERVEGAQERRIEEAEREQDVG